MRTCPVCHEWLIWSAWRQTWVCSSDWRECFRSGRDVAVVSA